MISPSKGRYLLSPPGRAGSLFTGGYKGTDDGTLMVGSTSLCVVVCYTKSNENWGLAMFRVASACKGSGR